MTAKEAAGRRAAELVRDGMVLGIGTGSTAEHAIRALGERVMEGITVVGVPSSRASARMAAQCGIRVLDFGDVPALDLTIDGADEVDPQFRLIKGGGGALVREKIVATASREMVVVVDESKVVQTLGAFPLPVAVVPFGLQVTLERLKGHCAVATLRERAGSTFVTDDGLYIVDLHLGAIEEPEALAAQIVKEPGVVDVGLFLGLATQVIVGYADGSTKVLGK